MWSQDSYPHLPDSRFQAVNIRLLGIPVRVHVMAYVTGGIFINRRAVGTRVPNWGCLDESRSTHSALSSHHLRLHPLSVGTVRTLPVVNPLWCHMDDLLYIDYQFQGLTSFKGEFSRWVGNGVLEEKKEKKRQREIVIQWKELVFFFSILVALQGLCNWEFVFHWNLKFKKKINSLTQFTLGFLNHNLPIRNPIWGLLSTFHRWGTGGRAGSKEKFMAAPGTRIYNSSPRPGLLFSLLHLIFSPLWSTKERTSVIYKYMWVFFHIWFIKQ